MGFISERLQRAVLGDSDARVAGQMRTLKGLRRGDRTELLIGLALSALAWLQKTEPKRELLYRKKVPIGSAIVVHHKKAGAPEIEVIKPKRKRS
ncbi:MAG: hypothetical protein KY394_04380 [Actinobacteria bacterium]|nr:hypothetical protein [Actinomycetota bacterium]